MATATDRSTPTPPASPLGAAGTTTAHTGTAHSGNAHSGAAGAPRAGRSALGGLRRVLLANSAFSAGSALACLLAAEPLADALGIDEPAVLVALGVGLAAFALVVDGAVIWSRRGSEPHRRLGRVALVVSIADMGWVLGTVVVLPLAGLTAVGNLVALAVALVVAALATAQLRHRRRL